MERGIVLASWEGGLGGGSDNSKCFEVLAISIAAFSFMDLPEKTGQKSDSRLPVSLLPFVRGNVLKAQNMGKGVLPSYEVHSYLLRALQRGIHWQLFWVSTGGLNPCRISKKPPHQTPALVLSGAMVSHEDGSAGGLWRSRQRLLGTSKRKMYNLKFGVSEALVQEP